MRLLSVFWKSMREQTRDIMVLSLSLVFAPFFVFLYSLFFPGGASTTYAVLVMNRDTGVQLADGATHAAGQEVVEAINDVTYADGNPLLRVKTVDDRAQAESMLRDREATALVVIPADFSQTIQAVRDGDQSASTTIVFGGDLTNPYYIVAAILATTAVDTYVQQETGWQPPVQFAEEPLGGSAARSEFETYVPGILVFAVVLLVFMASMTVTREVEAGTLRRLQITRLTAFELLGGITAALMVFSVIALLLAFLTALAFGFRSHGPLWVAILVGVVTSLSVLGAGLIVACFSKTVAQAFVLANFPLGLFMAFTGVMFPLPRVPLFTLAGHTVGLYDILPATHAVVALNKVLTLGAGFVDVLYELTALLILSTVYFAVGVWLFQRTHMTPA